MLEIAGGIVLGGAIIFALWLLLPLIAEGLARLSEWLVVGLGIALAVVLFYLGCWAAWTGYTWLCGIFGKTYVDLFAEPLVVGSIVIGLPLLWLDSLQGFKQTARFLRWIVRAAKPSTWKSWGQRRNLVGLSGTSKGDARESMDQEF